MQSRIPSRAGVTGLPVEPADVRRAATAIGDRVVRTPSAVSRTLSAITGATVAVKFENLQFTASYKERGALNRLLALDAGARSRGVVAASAGNFAQAVAFHASAEGVPATIVMPVGTPTVKATRTEELGAAVVMQGDDFDRAQAFARRLAEHDGLVYLSPYDDVDVIAGQGTVALEFLDDLPDLDTLLVPVGGGGLLAGMAVAARDLRPDIELVGVQAETYASMVAALRGQEPRCGGTTIADGIAVKEPGRITKVVIEALCDDVVTVPESRIEEAVCLYLEVEKVVAEGAAAAGLAALLEYPERFRGRRVGLVLTGGNIDLRLLASVIMRGLVRSERMACIRVGVPDTPGALGLLTAVIGNHGGNIVDLSHRRMLLGVSSRAVAVDVTVETRDAHSLNELLDGLHAAGYDAATIDGERP
jgi:threonine dehydratase